MIRCPNCYECEYRRKVAGSSHSECNHPAFAEALKNPMFQVEAIFASVGRVSPIQVKAESITVKGNSYGIRKGWFNHPFNFDPVWLDSCDGFKEKAK